MSSSTKIKICLLGLIIVLAASVLALTGCEPATRLTVENQMQTELKIIHQAIYQNGSRSVESVVGTVPQGQTVQLPGLFTLSQDIIGDIVLIKAEDPTGVVVWQKSWSFDDFLKLKDVGWKIVISPETSS